MHKSGIITKSLDVQMAL